MIKIYRTLTTAILTLIALSGVAQDIRYLKTPENYQLYARDVTDSADVSIHGRINDKVVYDLIELRVFKDETLFDTQKSSITGNQFRVSSRIDAGLHQFRFELSMNSNGVEQIVQLADSVVCGDAYIITGQSNSHASSSLSTYSSPYCRSFGVKTGYESYSDDDKKVRWGLSSGSCPELQGVGGWFKKNSFGVGVWGMELSRLIVEKHNVPVCIINGGSGSSSIEQNMLYPEIPSLETSFGRLAYRVNQAGLKDRVKAIFWHQGESNTDDRYLTYSDNFDTLQSDWRRVYGGLQHIYMFQLHPGCGKDHQSDMRQIQHQIADNYIDIDIMSTTGVVGHDGCHFSYEGYCEFAKRILPLVSRDIYGEIPDFIITAPNLLEAYYSKPDEITLEFDQNVDMETEHEVEGVKYLMKDQFFFNSDGENTIENGVKSIKIRGNRVTLKLKESTLYYSVTWLPNKNYIGTNICYQGPWIYGAVNGIGALSFHNIPLNSQK